MGSCVALRTAAQDVPKSSQTGAPISMAELSAKVGAQCQGDGLSVSPTPEGAQLRCSFQKLEGQATVEGLWLTSTVDGAEVNRFSVVATSMGRTVECVERGAAERQSLEPPPTLLAPRSHAPRLSRTGTVAVLEKLAAIQMLDVSFPTTDGRRLVMPRYTEPNPEQALLLHQLKLVLPQQPPPRITAAASSAPFPQLQM